MAPEAGPRPDQVRTPNLCDRLREQVSASAEDQGMRTMNARGLTWIAAGLVILMLAPWTARGQSPELQDSHDSFMTLLDKDYYEEALPYAQKAVALGVQEFGDYLASGVGANGPP